MKICFVTDGGVQMGMGHVQQSTTLAARFPKGTQITFLTRSDEVVFRMIEEAGFSVERKVDDGEILSHLRAASPDVVIFDKIDVDEGLAREIRQTLDLLLVIFTNLTEANRHAHIAVMAGMGSDFKNLRYVDKDTGTLHFFGPKYWVLRKEFHELRSKGKPSIDERVPGKVQRILLLFGGSDAANLTCVALDRLLGLEGGYRLDVVLGAHFGHDSALQEVLSRHADQSAAVSVHRNTKEVARLMHAADLVLTSPGLATYEALCVGTPIILLPQHSLQRDVYRGSMRLIEKAEISRLGKMIEARDFTSPSDPIIAAMEIGEGIPEIMDSIRSFAKPKTR